MSTYTTIPGFEDVYLEDSWILGIHVEPGSVAFDVEVVLLETHPLYSPPGPEEQYCYRRGTIIFHQVAEVNWTGQGVVVPAVDASGEQDFGSIDEFELADGSYALEGDFGRLVVRSAEPTLKYS